MKLKDELVKSLMEDLPISEKSAALMVDAIIAVFKEDVCKKFDEVWSVSELNHQNGNSSSKGH